MHLKTYIAGVLFFKYLMGLGISNIAIIAVNFILNTEIRAWMGHWFFMIMYDH